MAREFEMIEEAYDYLIQIGLNPDKARVTAPNWATKPPQTINTYAHLYL